jgi:hypothetical protein
LKSHFYEEPESAFWFSGKRKSKCILRSWSITSLSLSLGLSQNLWNGHCGSADFMLESCPKCSLTEAQCEGCRAVCSPTHATTHTLRICIV